MHRPVDCLLLASLLTGLACGAEAPATSEAAPPQSRIEEVPHDTAVLEVENLGRIRIELLREVAPRTVEHFERLVREGYYDGTTFHRVIPGFMIQGGDPLTRNTDPRDDGKGGSGSVLPDEFSDLPHERGMLAMANKGRSRTAHGQFFIVHQDSLHLDGGYTIFARVAEGMEVVDAVTQLPIDTYGRWGPPARPYPRDARILSVRLEPAATPDR
jgi:peptidyl-prolyl cis-trans isomerase B (cyclophilin B)